MVIKAVLRPTNIKTEKRIAIRVHDGGNTPKFKLIPKRKITKKSWNSNAVEDKKNWVRSTHPDSKEINSQINEYITRIRAEKTGEEPIDLLNTRRGANRTYLSYAGDYLKLIRNQSTRINNEQGLNKLEDYLTEIDNLSLSFNQINKNFCKAYYKWLRDKFSVSSTNQYFGVFRTIFNDAINDDSNTINTKHDPLANFKYDKNTTKNIPLSPNDFTKFLLFVPGSRKQLITKYLWLFQFSQAFRIKEVMLLRWKDLKYVKNTSDYAPEENKFLLDIHTSKTSARVVRNLSLPVVQLLIPSIQRYYPRVVENALFIQEQLEHWKKQLDELNDDKPFDISPESLLEALSGEKTKNELKNMVEHTKWHKDSVNNAKNEIYRYENELRDLLGEYFNNLHLEYGDDFVWDKPQKENIDINKLNDKNSESFSAYKRCLASNDGYLKRIKKVQSITTKLSSHTARHTASNFMIDGGVSMNKVSKVLTHSNYETTEIYFDRLGLNVEDATNLLSKKLSEF